jgi:hypothetical protein
LEERGLIHDVVGYVRPTGLCLRIRLCEAVERYTDHFGCPAENAICCTRSLQKSAQEYTSELTLRLLRCMLDTCCHLWSWLGHTSGGFRLHFWSAALPFSAHRESFH